jgi:hypothetical protein
MTKKRLNTQGIANELAGASVFFSPTPVPAPVPDSRTLKISPVPKPRRTNQAKAQRTPPRKFAAPAELQTHKVPDSQSSRETESETHRLTDFEDYDVPDYRRLRRAELRLTWEQERYLDDLEAVIARDMPEGERANPSYKRITKNSVLRALVEMARRLEVRVDARRFRNERDLAKAVFGAFREKFAKLQTDGVTD